MPSNDFYLKQGDTHPAIETQLKANGVPVSLPSGTTVTFRMKNAVTGVIVEGSGTIVYPSQQDPVANPTQCGVVSYSWPLDGSQTSTVGYHLIEWKVTFSSGRIITFPRGEGNTSFNQLVVESNLS